MPPEEKKSLLTRFVESKPPLYWWVLLNISMGCVAVVSWFYFVPTFNYPEVPENYERMIKLGRTPKLPTFSGNNAPDGKAVDAADIHRMFTSSEISDADIKELNRTLLRNYIQSVKLKKLNFYAKGTFKVIQARELNKDDLFHSGIVVQAKAQRRVGTDDQLIPFLVDIEYILPGVNQNALQHFQPGNIFELHQIPHYTALLHVKRTIGEDGETIIYTSLVPLTVDPPQTFENDISIQLNIPNRIFPQNPLPVFKDEG